MAPHDRFGAVWVIMMFLGMGTLFPWNVFIMLKYYFETRLKAPPTWPFFQTNFENIFVIVYQVSNCTTLAAMVLFARVPMSFRILLPYVVIMLAMAIQTCLVFVLKLSGMAIACMAIVTLVIMGIMCAIVQGGVYTKASILPLKYINAVIGGQGIAGFVVSLIQFITLATNSPQHPTNNSQANVDWLSHYLDIVQKPSFYYFLASTLVMLLCVVGYLVLSYHPFVLYYRGKHEVLIGRASVEHHVVGSEKEPLLGSEEENNSTMDESTASSGETPVVNVESDAGGTLMHLEGQGKVYDIEGIGFSFCPAVHVVRVPPVPHEQNLNPLIRRSADQHDLEKSQRRNSSSKHHLKKKSHSLDYRIFSDIFELLHRENQTENQENENHHQNQNGKTLQQTGSQEKLISHEKKQQQQQQKQFWQMNDDINRLSDDEVYEETVVQIPNSFSKQQQKFLQQQQKKYGFSNLFYDVGIYASVVFLTFFIDMLVFPAVTQNIESTVKPSSNFNFFNRLSQDLFMPCLFILFTGGEMVGRFACGYGPWAKKPPHSIILLLYALLRCAMASGLLFCNVIPINGSWKLPVLLESNLWPALINGLMGLTTGHLGGTAMMHAPGLVPPTQRERCGSLITFAFGGGLMSGSFLSLAIVASLQTQT